MRAGIRATLLLSLVLPVILSGSMPSVSAQRADRNDRVARTGANELVAVVWDATDEAGCTMEIAEGDGPFRSVPCPPGSVVYALTTTAADARALAREHRGETVSLSGDARENELLIGEVVDRVHEAAAPSRLQALQACGSSKTISGSYNVDGRRARYSMQYQVVNCTTVRNVSDRGWAIGTDSGRVEWRKSCTNGNSSCRTRNIVLTDNPTSWRAEDNSVVGRQYRHQSINIPACQQGICINAYGYWYFD